MEFSLNPNPARDFIVLDIKDYRLLHKPAVLADLTGRVLIVTNIKEKQQRISLAGLAAGIYILKLQEAAIRIVKEQE